MFLLESYKWKRDFNPSKEHIPCEELDFSFPEAVNIICEVFTVQRVHRYLLDEVEMAMWDN